jgi:hypothetical protein
MRGDDRLGRLDLGASERFVKLGKRSWDGFPQDPYQPFSPGPWALENPWKTPAPLRGAWGEVNTSGLLISAQLERVLWVDGDPPQGSEWRRAL